MSRARTVQAARPALYARDEPEFWAVIDGYEYALHQTHVVSASWVSELREAASSAFAVFSKVAGLAPFLPADVLIEMGIPRSVHPLLAHDVTDLATNFARFDFIESTGGFKVIELNAETPFFVVETHRINGLACREAGLKDPNEHAEGEVVEAMCNIAAESVRGAFFAVTASNVYREDFMTASYFARLWERALRRSVPVVPLHELGVDRGGLHFESTHIDVLHRCYPLEHFASDRGGDDLLSAVAGGKVKLVNPPSALFLQSKMTLALIWGLYERDEFFDRKEREAIARLFLPCYADEARSGRWVRKPILGREGNAVTLLNDGVAMHHTEAPYYSKQPMIVQRYVAPPVVTYSLSDGSTHTGYAVATCAVVGGRAGAVGMRIGGEITDAWAHFQPLGVDS